jgi:hypothetical protein
MQFTVAGLLLGQPWAPRHQEQRRRLAEAFATRPRDGVSARMPARCLWNCGAIMLRWGNRTAAEAVWRDVDALAARTKPG